ncbi:MAG: hypothetical protein R3C18_12300 [Planctomycetaceae bacterium]
MQQSPLTKRNAILAGILTLAILAVSFLIGWFVRMNKSDTSTADRLHGKWAVYSSADESKPTCIYEWSPNGQMQCYSLDGHAVYSTSSQPKWWVRNGEFRYQIKIDIPKGANEYVTEDIHVDSIYRWRIDWIDEDTVRMQDITDGSEGELMVFRRRNSG